MNVTIVCLIGESLPIGGSKDASTIIRSKVQLTKERLTGHYRDLNYGNLVMDSEITVLNRINEDVDNRNYECNFK